MKARSRILAVDDDPMNLAVMEEILGEEYTLKLLDSGRNVVDTARSFRPDLVLLDIMMPDISGYEVCRRLRAEPVLRHLKVVLVSAKALLSERLEGYEAGADDYVTKPFAIDEFLAKVRVYLRLKSVEEVDELKTHFLNLLNHETRTPLTNILAPAELLSGDRPPADDIRRELAGIITENALRLQKLFERVNLLSGLRNGEVDIECSAVDCGDVLNSALELVAGNHPDRGITVRRNLSNDSRALAHPGYLQMVFESILDNAFRFSPDRGTVAIETVVDMNGIRIDIIDNGPGITDELLPHVFDGLRVGDIDHHSRGNGLGLAIARYIIESAGGTIGVASIPGVETRFSVRLPSARESRAA